MNEEKFVLGIVSVIGLVIAVLIISASGCERELNKLKSKTYSEAIAKGCTVITGDRIHLICDRKP